MRAVVFGGVREVRVADVPDAVVEEPDDAVVRVTRTAICGSDLHFFHGKAPIEPGDVLGHEALSSEQRAALAAIDRSELMLAANSYRHKRDNRKTR